MKTVPVILAGGKGERFWPLSRASRPKQLLPLFGKKTMIEETVARARAVCGNSTPLVITGSGCAAGIRKVLSGKGRYHCIVEPVGKNTAPAIALAAVWIRKRYGDAVMLVASADHAIAPRRKYAESVRVAVEAARDSDSLVVFGIVPTRPDVGYGYIQLGKRLQGFGTASCFSVRRFVEKPTPAVARRFVASKAYLWNSGMFVWKASVILGEFERSMPALYRLAMRAAGQGFTKSAIRAFYSACESRSIDYGIMENASRIVAVRGTFFWDDIGSWEAMGRIHPHNAQGTVSVGPSVFESRCKDSIVYNASRLTVAAVGLADTVMVVTPDAVLAIARPLLPHVKTYLAMMKKRNFSLSVF